MWIYMMHSLYVVLAWSMRDLLKNVLNTIQGCGILNKHTLDRSANVFWKKIEHSKWNDHSSAASRSVANPPYLSFSTWQLLLLFFFFFFSFDRVLKHYFPDCFKLFVLSRNPTTDAKQKSVQINTQAFQYLEDDLIIFF